MAAPFLTRDMGEVLERLVNAMPDFQRLHTVAEMDARDQALVREFPRTAAIEEIGTSRMGRTLRAVTVGTGRMTVLLLGFPHPDEGVGALVLDHLLRTAADRPEILRAFNARIVAVRCWDIDGAALNEGWFPGGGTFEAQARQHFRPPAAMQMEWTFPVEYKAHQWTTVPPETEAVRRLIEREQPRFMMGLHNAAFHDPYFYLSTPAPEAYGPLAEAVAAEHLKLSDRSPDVPFEEELAPGVFKMYGLKEYYDYYEKFAPERLKHLKRGACSDEYLAMRVPGSFSFNAEVPRLMDRRIRDRTPTARGLRDVVLARLKVQQAEFERLDRVMVPLLERHASHHSLLCDSVRLHLEEFHGKGDASAAEVKSDPQYEHKATVAHVFENEVIGPFEDMLVVGEGWRAATELAGLGDAAAKKAATDLGARLHAASAVLTGKSKFEPIAIKRSASVQLRSLLLLMGWRAKALGL